MGKKDLDLPQRDRDQTLEMPFPAEIPDSRRAVSLSNRPNHPRNLFWSTTKITSNCHRQEAKPLKLVESWTRREQLQKNC